MISLFAFYFWKSYDGLMKANLFSRFLVMGLVLVGLTWSMKLVAGEETPAPAEGAAEEPPKSAKQMYFELERLFYTDRDLEKSKAKSVESHRKQVESKAEAYLTNIDPKKETEIKTWAKKNLADVLAMQDNYRATSKEAKFAEQTLTFKFQIMCECYAEAYQALAKEDLYAAQSAMKRAIEKRREIRDSLAKQ
jgi:hypothetical protein